MAEDREDNQLDPPVPVVTAWTSDRRELHRWFTDNAPSLASAYEGAVRLLGVPGFPGRTHMISHVVRDICNRLPDFLGSVERDRLHYDRELDALSEVWPSSIGPSADDYVAGGGEAGGDSHVQIPPAAAAAVSRLLARHRERQSHREITRDLFSLVSDGD